MFRVSLQFFSVVLFLAACSPATNTPARLEVADLVGLWNSSENNGAKTDVMYTRISSNGGIIEYDFDGDLVDQGLPCYQVETGSIRALGNNRFLISDDMHEGSAFKVEVELLDAGHALKVSFIENATGQVTMSQIWTREPDASILDKEPACKQE